MSQILFLALCLSMPVVGYLAARQTRRWVGLGNPLWGWISGPGVLGLFFLALQLFVASQQRAGFNRIGLCSICYEYSGLAFLLVWGAGLVAVLVFLVAALRQYDSLNPGGLHLPFPHTGVWWLAGTFLILCFWFALPRLGARLEQARLVAALDDPTPNQGQLAGFLELPLSLPKEIMGSSTYVSPEGMDFSPDGKWLALSLYNRSSTKYQLELRRLPGLDLVLRLSFLTYEPVSVAFSRSGERLVLVGHDRAWLYELRENSVLLTWDVAVKGIYNATPCFLSQDQHLLILSGSHIVVLDLNSAAELEQRQLPRQGPYYSPVMDPACRWIAWRTSDAVWVWQWQSAPGLVQLPTQALQDAALSNFPSLHYMPDGQLLEWPVPGYQDGRAPLAWNSDLSRSELLPLSFNQPSQPPVFSPDAHWMALVQSNIVTFYDTSSWQPGAQFTLPAAVTALEFSSDSRYLVVASADGRLRWFAP